MKRLLWIPVGFIGLIGIAAIAMILTLRSNMATIREVPINDIDLEEIVDGTYTGSYYFEDQIGATLEVVVEDHQIVDILIVEHICGKGTIAESILEDIIEHQSLEVDAVAGATTSSHVLKLSIQNALEDQ